MNPTTFELPAGLLPHFLTQPRVNADAATLGAFEELYQASVMNGTGAEIVYRLDAPKWQFLNYLCEGKKIVLHGSGNRVIQEFEPRKANDVMEFGNRRAVYAASDALWAMYFAIVNRDNVSSLVNSCARVVGPHGKSEPFYFFSINAEAFGNEPWHDGMIYLLPGETFEQQPSQPYRGMVIESAQWASLVAVRPLAKLAVTPADFPFLNQVVPHDPKVIQARAVADPDGFPWMDEAAVAE